MFQITDEMRGKIAWAMVLIPGFLAVSVASLLSNRAVASDFEYLYFSLFWSLVVATIVGTAIIVLFMFVFWFLIGRTVFFVPLSRDSNYAELNQLFSDPSIRVNLSTLSITRDLLFGLFVLLSSTGLGVGLAYVHSTDYLFDQLRESGVEHPILSLRRPVAFLLESNRQDNLNLLGDGRKEGKQRSFVEIVDKKGNRFAGMPRLYPSGNASSEIHLSPACVFDAESMCWARHRGAGVTLYERELARILWVDDEGSACFVMWEPCSYCEDPTTLSLCNLSDVALKPAAKENSDQ